MKALVKILVILAFLISPACASAFDVLVLPADLLSTKENYYNFDEMSEIIANDVINNFNRSNGKIKSLGLYEIRAKFNQNPELKNEAQKALDKYKNINSIDYEAFKRIGKDFSHKYVLVLTSSVSTEKNSLKRSVWEVLEVSSDFNVTYPFKLETSAVLLDTSANLVMWSGSCSINPGDNNNSFKAENYAQANGQLEKLKLYSKTAVAASISQNVILRFYPKAIRPVEREIKENSGGALKFDRNIPEKPKKENQNNEEFYGEMIYGI